MAAYSLTASSVVPSAAAKYLAPVVAGAAITAGQPVYVDTSGLAQLSDCNASAAAADVQGLAAHNVAAGQPLLICYEDPSWTHGLAAVTAGLPIFNGGTAGTLVPPADLTTGDYVSLLGIAISATKMSLRLVKSGVAKA